MYKYKTVYIGYTVSSMYMYCTYIYIYIYLYLYDHHYMYCVYAKVALKR